MFFNNNKKKLRGNNRINLRKRKGKVLFLDNSMIPIQCILGMIQMIQNQMNLKEEVMSTLTKMKYGSLEHGISLQTQKVNKEVHWQIQK